MIHKMKISVCIPCYNNPVGALRAVTSVAEQLFDDFECIITDDSTDNGVEQAIAPFLKDERFKYIRNTPALGTPANWNKAIRESSGALIKILHHDDWLSTPESLAIFHTFAVSNPDYGFFASARNHYDARTNALELMVTDGRLIGAMNKDRFFSFAENFIGVPSVTLFRRDFFQYYDERLKFLVDVEQYMAVLANTKLFYIKDPLVNVTIHGPTQVTRQCEYNIDVQLREGLMLAEKLWGKNIPISAMMKLTYILSHLIFSCFSQFTTSLRSRYLFAAVFAVQFIRLSLSCGMKKIFGCKK